jgi:hypothetical protein
MFQKLPLPMPLNVALFSSFLPMDDGLTALHQWNHRFSSHDERGTPVHLL